MTHPEHAKENAETLRPPASGTAVEAEDLVIAYATPRGPVIAVNGVSLAVREGEAVALVGESGCGKSTLGRGLMGLLPKGAAAKGRVLLKDRDVLAMPLKARRRLFGREAALIFQDPMTRLDPLMRVEEHFFEVFRAHGLKLAKDAMRAKAAATLAEVGVPASRLLNYPHEMSGGQRQRVMIALGLVLDPAFLVADEPTTSLDVIVEAQIMDLLDRLKRERGMGVLLVTHNLALVADAADRVAVMYAGDLVEVAPVKALFDHAAHPYTRGLLASTIHLDTTALASIPGAPPDLASPPTGCRFHPRCPRAREICRDARPPLVEQGEDHGALCWFPGPDGAVVPQAPEEAWGRPLAPQPVEPAEQDAPTPAARRARAEVPEHG